MYGARSKRADPRVNCGKTSVTMSMCWCGDDHEPHCPTCEKCGAPVTTGAMALICPNCEQCFFWPDEGISDTWLKMFPNDAFTDVQLRAADRMRRVNCIIEDSTTAKDVDG